ncbi:B12-binding domain-containing radical SAM protein [Pseudooceanicola sp.]|uniref:B12-binding domain-containing radical SAM protein n=1 Tax=Pseudooceanicola sp. TaxID=1914328 RepID=UPI0035C6BD26
MILLINGKSHEGKKRILPVSLLAVAATFDGKLPYEILDGNHMDDPVEEIATHVARTGARILAFTVMPGPQTASSFELTVALKQRFPDLIVIWGAYFPTMYPRATMSCPGVDYAVRGYVGLDLADWLKSLLEGSPILCLPGLVYRDPESGDLVQNPMSRLVDINTLPPFPYHAVDMEYYMRPTFLGSRTISHHISLGCPFKCGFCGVVAMVNGKTSAERADVGAAGVARLVEEYGANAIEFNDNNFFLGEARTQAFCKAIAHLGIRWWAYGRADTLDKYSDETWAAMADSGLHMIYIGAESGSDETLRKMNKGGKQSVNGVLKLAETMKRHGIVPEFSFIIGNPPDPVADMEQTLSFILKIKEINPLSEIILYSYTPVPQEGEMLAAAQEAGFAFPDDVQDWSSEHWQRICRRREGELPWITPEIRRKLINFRLVMDSAFPTNTDGNLKAWQKLVLQAAGGWRLRSNFHAAPYDLRLLNRLIPFQRPETAGF